MAMTLLSPGFRSDEDDEIAVFESTAAELGDMGRPRLPEISVISPGLDRHPSTTEKVSHFNYLVFESVMIMLYL